MVSFYISTHSVINGMFSFYNNFLPFFSQEEQQTSNDVRFQVRFGGGGGGAALNERGYRFAIDKLISYEFF